MAKVKTTNSKTLLQKELKDKNFAEEYEKLEEEFALAKEIIQLRMESKMTQKELAQKVGTSQPAIARLESGTYKNVSLSFLRRVGAALGAHPEIHFHRIRS